MVGRPLSLGQALGELALWLHRRPWRQIGRASAGRLASPETRNKSRSRYRYQERLDANAGWLSAAMRLERETHYRIDRSAEDSP